MRQISLFRRRQVLLKMATLSCPGRQLSCSTGPSPPTHLLEGSDNTYLTTLAVLIALVVHILLLWLFCTFPPPRIWLLLSPFMEILAAWRIDQSIWVPIATLMPGIIWKVYVPMLVCPPTLKFAIFHPMRKVNPALEVVLFNNLLVCFLMRVFHCVNHDYTNLRVFAWNRLLCNPRVIGICICGECTPCT